MISKVVNALLERDYRALGSCFSENCTYFDYCPALNGDQNYYIYGNVCIEMFFREKFASKRYRIAEPIIESARRASFFCEYNDGPYIFARMDIEEFDNMGLIKKAVIHPA